MSERRAKTGLIEGAWVSHRLAMKESHAWRALPNNARRVLDLLETEHMRQGGSGNGQLVYTYDQFEEDGIRRASVPLAIRQCVELGFLQVTRIGYKSAAEFRIPSLYRLTYVYGRKRGMSGKASRQNPTDEWERLVTEQDVVAALERAKHSPRSSRRVRSDPIDFR